MYALLGLSLSVFAAAQQSPSPKLSTTALTPEQIAVYRSFLAGYNGSKARLNLANTTTTFEPNDDPRLSGGQTRDDCLKPFPAEARATEVHLLPDSFATSSIRLVDPTTHKLSDPGDAIRRGQRVGAAVDAGFAAGLMTLSEIIFDAPHHLAAFRYSFVCGGLCGNGGIIIFELRNGHWKQSSRQCARWIS